MDKEFFTQNVNHSDTSKYNFSTHVSYLKGVGPKLGSILESRGITTLADLLLYFPRAYEYQKAVNSISQLKTAEVVQLIAYIHHTSSTPLGSTGRMMYNIQIKDHSGTAICRFFRLPYGGFLNQFFNGQRVRILGKVSSYKGKLEFHHPDIKGVNPDEIIQEKLIPIYPEIEDLSSERIQRLIALAWSHLSQIIWSPERLPPQVISSLNLLSFKEALFQLHFPLIQYAELYNSRRSPAHYRLIFEELFHFQAELIQNVHKRKKLKGFSFAAEGKLASAISRILPFDLTPKQAMSYSEIFSDCKNNYPMNRLLQGDVGCGKTIVAFLAIATAFESEFQSCLLVPTEILAEQHHRSAINWMSSLSWKGKRFNISLLTGSVKNSDKQIMYQKISQGEIDFVIGTHALLEDSVVFNKLGLVVIDEQHRFGVEQREILKRKSGLKNYIPHFLVMTATPIPRTLALTAYGEMDTSIIDELPSGRIPILTKVIMSQKRNEVFDFLEKQILNQRQAYIIYPLIEEQEKSAKIDLKNAIAETEKLRQRFPHLKIGLVHSKLPSEEKSEIMNDFKLGNTQILVSTTVIEVGVDVPNASLIIIEHAERFGLSQLHQLRGRVGRGKHPSFCLLLLNSDASEEAVMRVKCLEKSTDGFQIAEDDLKIRGPGEMLGTRQAGILDFMLADMSQDFDILNDVRRFFKIPNK